jgi:hypothetical protein
MCRLFDGHHSNGNDEPDTPGSPATAQLSNIPNSKHDYRTTGQKPDFTAQAGQPTKHTVQADVKTKYELN